MEFRQIEYVVGAVEHGGFTRAARALHVTQPALSEGIARLEAELGVALFDRVGRRVLPTAAGTAFIEPARQLLRDRTVLRASVAAVIGLTAGRLDLVALPTLAIDPLSRLVGAFRHAHPRIAVHIEQPEDATSVATGVRSGQSEVGVAELPLTGPGLVSEPLAEQEFILALPASSGLAGRSRVTISELADVALIVTPPGTSMRRLIDAAFADAGISPTIAVQTEQRESILPLVGAGAGAGILPGPLATTAATANVVTAALSPPVRRTIGLVWRDGPISPAAQAFIELSRDLRRDAP